MAEDTGGSVVLDQRPTTRFSVNGRFEEVYEITFKTPSNIISHVYVPRAAFNARVVAEAVREETRHIEEVHQLGKQ